MPNETTPAKKFGLNFFLGAFIFIGLLFAALIIFLVINAKSSGLSNSFIAQIGVNPTQIKNFLLILVNFTFGLISFILFIILFIYIFRAIFLKNIDKHLRAKNWILTLINLTLLAATIIIWILIFRIITSLTINANLNINANIVIKDNTTSKIINPTNLTAPISLNFNASKFAQKLSTKNQTVISYQWDLNGDGIYDKQEVGNPINKKYLNKGENNGVFPISLKLLIKNTKTGKSTWQENKNLETISISAIRPTINLLPPPANLTAPALITLDASTTIDPDSPLGSPITYHWQLDHQKLPETSPILQHNFTQAGTYTITLTATDIDGNATTKNIPLTINPSQLSTVKLSITSTPTTGAAPLNTILKAKLFNPNNIKIKKYQWDFGDNSLPEIGKVINHTYQKSGQYQLTLTIFDQINNTKSTTTTITPYRSTPAPHINLSTVPTHKSDPKGGLTMTGKAPLKILFDASRTTDADHNIDSYYWDFGDTNTTNGKKVYHTFYKGGIYTIALTVTDADQNKSQKFLTINVNQNPVKASISANKLAGEAPLDITFDASGSSSTTKPIIAYLWDFGDKINLSTQKARIRHTFLNPGIYPITLTIKTQNGQSATTTSEIIVSLITIKANFTTSRSSGLAPLTTSFDSSTSHGSITSYLWDFNDNSPQQSQPNPTHTFTKPGRYQVTLKVQDNKNNFDQYSQIIEVK